MPSFVEAVLEHDPSFLLDFRRGLSRFGTDLSGNAVTGEVVGSAPPVTGGGVVPSDGVFGSSTTFVSDSGNTMSGSCAYRIPVATTSVGGPLRPTAATLIIACSRPSYQRYGGIFSCTQAGGWNIEVGTATDYVNAQFRINGAYVKASCPWSTLAADSNLLIATCDGQYVRLYVNGEMVAESDAGSLGTIQYSTSSVTHICLGAEPAADAAVSSFLGLSIQYASLIPSALTVDQCQQIAAAFTATCKISGTVVQDDGSAGRVARIRAWYGSAIEQVMGGAGADVVVSSPSGAYEAIVPSGDYEVVLVGGDGFQPVAHGPITPIPTLA